MKKIILILFFQFLFSQSLVDFDLSKSFISYDGKHPAHNWTGISKDIQGTFKLNEEDLTKSKVDLFVPVFSFDSKNSNRDSNMLDVIEEYFYPSVGFYSSSIIKQKHNTYSLTEGISEKVYNKIIFQIIKNLPKIDEWHSKNILKNFDNISWNNSIRANFGWNIMEGNHCYPENSDCSSIGLVNPSFEYPNNANYAKTLFGIKQPNMDGCSITGGYVYRGDELIDMYGRYIFGDYCTGKIWSINIDQDGGSNLQNHTATIMDSISKKEFYIFTLFT